MKNGIKKNEIKTIKGKMGNLKERKRKEKENSKGIQESVVTFKVFKESVDH